MQFDRWRRTPTFAGQRSECEAGRVLHGNVGATLPPFWSHDKGFEAKETPCSCPGWRGPTGGNPPRSTGEKWLAWAKQQPEWDLFVSWFRVNCDHLDKKLTPKQRWSIFQAALEAEEV